VFNEKGLVKALKDSYGRGYDVLCGGHQIAVVATNWAVKCGIDGLPVKASLQIVENVGYMPAASVKVRAGEDNQYITPEMTNTLGFGCLSLEPGSR
jgi:hypothetical protein